MSGDKFVLTIDLENEAMQSYNDLSNALQKLAAKFARMDDKPNYDDGAKVLDANGNTVGRWEIKGAHDDKDD